MPPSAASSGDHHRTAQLLPGGRSVILLHTLPDGSSHFDWLLESVPACDVREEIVDPSDRSLVCFRCGTRPDQLAVQEEITIERLPAHRRLYLEYEGPINGDRGNVKRVAAARIVRVDAAAKPSDLQILLHWDADPRCAINPGWFRLSPMQDVDQWKVSCVDRRNVECADFT